jgi:hypothetical protein
MSTLRIIAAGFLICLLVLTGCSSTKTPKSIVDKTLSAITQVKSFQLDTDFTDGAGDLWQGTKVVNVSDKEMGMNMAITMGPYITISDEMYFMDGLEYCETISKENSPQTFGWTKNALTNDVWSSEIQMPFFTELLKTASKFSSMGTERLNNVDCYVLTVTPSAQASADFVFSQGQPGGPAFYSPDIEGGYMVTPDLYYAGSIELWVSQDDYLPLKVDAEFGFKQAKSNLPAATTTSPIITNYHCELDFSNYNQPASIQVPRDALNAPLDNTVQ